MEKEYMFKAKTNNGKNKWHKYVACGAIAVMLSTTLGCNQQSKDKEIKADIAVKTKSDLNFVGVNYTVEQGTVTLTGKCPSDKSKAEAEQTIKGINIIKGINNQIIIAPVTITADLPLKQAVDSVLKDYPTIQADVLQNVVTLTGKAKKQDASQLLPALNSLHPASISNQLLVE
jgi:osmotically-inducible protein OsmY